jgi:hypothetical protein
VKIAPNIVPFSKRIVPGGHTTYKAKTLLTFPSIGTGILVTFQSQPRSSAPRFTASAVRLRGSNSFYSIERITAKRRMSRTTEVTKNPRHFVLRPPNRGSPNSAWTRCYRMPQELLQPEFRASLAPRFFIMRPVIPFAVRICSFESGLFQYLQEA